MDASTFVEIKTIKRCLPKLPRSNMEQDEPYLVDGGCSTDLGEDVEVADKISNSRFLVGLRDEDIVQSGAETRGIMYLKIFRLRTTPRKKMDAKALGRDEVIIYKALFGDIIMFEPK